MSNKIDSDKIFINKAFEWWYRVPDYQRPYVWGTDQVTDLLDDVTEWMYARPDSEYFLGSIVLQERHDNGITEYDLLDGQQRMTTFLLMYAVGRDLAQDDLLENLCRGAVFQQENPYKGIPERFRIIYDIRDEVRNFINEFIKKPEGTKNEAGLKGLHNFPDISVRNMANAVLQIRYFFTQNGAPSVEDFFTFFGNKVLMVYVSSPDLDDAFRMFTVLNDRGMKLRGSDILKTLNLRSLKEDEVNPYEQRRWAKRWEELEGDLGDDFDVFLSHLRAILVKDKARLSLLQEFQENIYAPKVFDRTTKTFLDREPLLRMGLDTFKFVENYYSHYQKVILGNNYKINNSWRMDNLITLLRDASQADFWVPPLLRYFDAFGEKRLVEFVEKLEAKFCGDWVTYRTPTDRIKAMNQITTTIDAVVKKPIISNDIRIQELLDSEIFYYDTNRFRQTLENDGVYGRRFARYLLFKLDVLFASPDTRLQVPSTMSVEHILPQNPDSASNWVKDFSEEDRETWTHKIGNLVLLNRRKNSAQGRRDFADKKEKYFKNNVEIFPNSVRVMQKDKWDLDTLAKHHKEVVDMLCS
jgi:hypothetical protein